MKSENAIDPKIIEEIIKFNKNVIEAPELVPAPDEILIKMSSRHQN
jgi:polyhydroxyalkanoate synthase